MIRDRITKACDSFMGSRFEINSLGKPLFDELARVRKEVIEQNELKKVSKLKLREYLQSINGDNMTPEKPSQLEVMHHFVAREKATYTTLNMLSFKDSEDRMR